MFKISVIIPVYNRTDELIMTLDTLLAQTLDKKDFEVVIADDGSKEDIQSVLKKYPELNTVYCFQEDLGFRVAAVRNLGMKNASGKIIVFNDNGILLTPNALENHIKYHENEEKLVVLGNMFATDWKSDTEKVRILLENKTVTETISEIKLSNNSLDGREASFERYGNDINSWKLPFLALWGGHFSIKREFIDMYDIAFDENFTSWGGEDNEYGVQICKHNGKLIFAREIEVIHYPTPNRENQDIKSKEFKENHRKAVIYIDEKHNTPETNFWRKISESNL